MGNFTGMSSVKPDRLRDAIIARLGTFQPLALDEDAEISDATWVAAVQQAAPVVGSWMRARQIPSDIVEATLGDIDRHPGFLEVGPGRDPLGGNPWRGRPSATAPNLCRANAHGGQFW